MTPAMKRLHAALLLVVALFVTLELSRYLTTPLWRNQFAMFPEVGVTVAGEARYWKTRWIRDDVGRGTRQEYLVYDAERRPERWVGSDDPAVAAHLRGVVATAWIGQPQMEESPLYRSGSSGPPWMPLYSPIRADDAARDAYQLASSIRSACWSIYPNASCDLVDGRFVLREFRTRRTLGGIGPDGWTAGDAGARGDGFRAPEFLTWGLERADVGSSPRSVVVILDRGARTLVFVRGAPQPSAPAADAADPRHPGPATVPEMPFLTRRIPIEGSGEIRSLRGPLSSQGPVAVAVGDEIRAFGLDGTPIGSMPWDAREEVPLATQGGARFGGVPGIAAIVTTAGRPSPIGASIRFRVLAAGKPPIVTDVALEPVTTAESVVADIRRGIAVVRPPILSLASFASPRPESYEQLLSAWLLDPLYAGASEPLTLAMCLALGAVCALRARSQARLRCAAPRDIARWTAAAFALGPLGLVWMRMVVPRHEIKTCACGRRRAVSVETCAGCGAAWPDPPMTGIEVFAAPPVPAVATV